MTSVFLKTWALFFGFAIISLAHGLQGTLLGVRAIVEGFSFISTGFIVSGYYVGYLTGSIFSIEAPAVTNILSLFNSLGQKMSLRFSTIS